LFITTFSSKEAAGQFARRVVESELAVCVNIVPGIQSIYRWKDNIEDSQEFLALGKTTQARFIELKSKIRSLHPYELPELIAFKIDDGLPEYLDWITV